MIRILASGPLVNDPVERVSAKGAPYVTCSLRALSEGESILVSAICFDPRIVAELVLAKRGETVSLAGRGGLRSWTGKDGEQHGMSVLVDRAMTVSPPKPELKVKPESKGKLKAKPESESPIAPLKPWPTGTTLEDIPSDIPF